MLRLLLCFLAVSLFVADSHQSSVSVSAAKSKVGLYYAQGCSGLTAELLGKPWKAASSYTQSTSIGSNGKYSGVEPGDIVGFSGHVAVYIGESTCTFVDVPGPEKNARCLTSYGSTTVYKYDY